MVGVVEDMPNIIDNFRIYGRPLTIEEIWRNSMADRHDRNSGAHESVSSSSISSSSSGASSSPYLYSDCSSTTCTIDTINEDVKKLISEIIEGLKNFYIPPYVREKIYELSKICPSIKKKETTIDGIDDELFRIE